MNHIYLISVLAIAFSFNLARADFSRPVRRYDFQTALVNITIWMDDPYQEDGQPALYGLTVSPGSYGRFMLGDDDSPTLKDVEGVAFFRSVKKQVTVDVWASAGLGLPTSYVAQDPFHMLVIGTNASHIHQLEIDFPVDDPEGQPRLNIFTAKGYHIVIDRRMTQGSDASIDCGQQLLAEVH